LPVIAVGNKRSWEWFSPGNGRSGEQKSREGMFSRGTFCSWEQKVWGTKSLGTTIP